MEHITSRQLFANQAGQIAFGPKVTTSVNTGSFLCFIFVVLSTLVFWKRNLLGQSGQKVSQNDLNTNKTERCIVQRMEQEDKNCVVFFGSQTGNAQDFAEKLVKEGHSRFDLRTMVADLEDYDYETLCRFPSDKIAIFILSSYGEGEPTDNAVEFFNFITSDEPSFSENKELPLQFMKYAAFGLGNSTYEYFNGVVRKVDDSLQRLGASPITVRGEGDDGNGTQEDEFMAWKDAMWNSLKSSMGLQEHEETFEPSFNLVENPVEADSIFLGERSKTELMGCSTEHGPLNPFTAKVLGSRELFNSPDRNCLHMDIDLRGSGLVYETGDHVAVWPSNSDIEVDRFLRVFGLIEKRHNSIQITPIGSIKQHIPSPTTYDAAARYYLEICGPVSRQFVRNLAAFASNSHQKENLLRLARSKELFGERICSNLFNIAQLIESISPDCPVFPIPFEVLLEGVRHLQPRYYSISSSSLVDKDIISLTTVVESVKVSQNLFKGVSSNYLLAIKRAQNGEQLGQNESPYAVNGPRNKYKSASLPIHVRHSSFKLPHDSVRPIVMIGPGTGVAPFRAFVQERIKQVQSGINVGKMILFFGCRNDQDFIYREDWKKYEQILGDNFKVYTSFSRKEASKKVYVQHRLVEHEKELRSFLLDQGGYVYVCGSIRMARDVQYTLGGLLQQPLCNGEETVNQLKTAEKYQEDVW